MALDRRAEPDRTITPNGFRPKRRVDIFNLKIDRSKPEEYQKATNYGISLGIPKYQVDFAPNVIEWKR
jgi:hypothetical protein